MEEVELFQDNWISILEFIDLQYLYNIRITCKLFNKCLIDLLSHIKSIRICKVKDSYIIYNNNNIILQVKNLSILSYIHNSELMITSGGQKFEDIISDNIPEPDIIPQVIKYSNPYYIESLYLDGCYHIKMDWTIFSKLTNLTNIIIISNWFYTGLQLIKMRSYWSGEDELKDLIEKFFVTLNNTKLNKILIADVGSTHSISHYLYLYKSKIYNIEDYKDFKFNNEETIIHLI